MSDQKKGRDMANGLGKEFSRFVEDTAAKRESNGEYQRGYRDGQHKMALAVSKAVEKSLEQFNDVAEMGKSPLPGDV